MPDGYDIWSVDGKPVSVHLRASVGAFIRASSSAESESGRATECGGILWGRVRDTGENYYIVSIEHAEAVECRHDLGEGWALSGRDRGTLGKHLKHKHGDLQPVGYWRAHQRRGLYLDKRDFDLMSALFAQPWCVALCVLPTGRAGFFLWEDGDIRRTSSYREFQLPDAVQPANAARPDPALRWRRWAAVAACAIILTVAPLLLKSKNSSGTPFNMLSMRAETASGTLRLRWNPQSRALAAGQGAILWIADGAEESKLELTSDQVRAGLIEYRPSGEDVNFRMQVGEFTESLRVHGAIPAQTPVQEAAVVQQQPEVSPEVSDFQPPPRAADSEPKRSRRSRSVAVASRTQPSPGPTKPSVSELAKEQDEVPPPPQIAAAPARLEDRPPLPPTGTRNTASLRECRETSIITPEASFRLDDSRT